MLCLCKRPRARCESEQWRPLVSAAGVCGADQRAERVPGAAAGERGGDLRAEGGEEQHTSQYYFFI